MPPKLHIVRHAQGEHNATRDYTLRDPLLTPLGKSQCARLCSEFPHHSSIDLVLCSPLRRCIQTASYSFGLTLARKEVQFVLSPLLQEVSDLGCDVGLDADVLESKVAEMFEGEDMGFDWQKTDARNVTEGWNKKQGKYAYTKSALLARTAELRNHLFQRPEAQIVVVTHGAIAHFITEDWDVDDPMTGTAYKNCEVREFVFSEQSSAEDAHLVETKESKTKRPAEERESDEHVLEELEIAVHGHGEK